MRKKWKVPVWMKPYTPYISNWERVMEFMNCDGQECNIVVNAPRALMCTALQTRIMFLVRLHEAGLLKEVK